MKVLKYFFLIKHLHFSCVVRRRHVSWCPTWETCPKTEKSSMFISRPSINDREIWVLVIICSCFIASVSFKMICAVQPLFLGLPLLETCCKKGYSSLIKRSRTFHYWCFSSACTGYTRWRCSNLKCALKKCNLETNLNSVKITTKV